MVKHRKETQLTKMEEEDDDTLEVDIEDFKDILKKFSSKNMQTYDFLIKAGPQYKMAMYKLCKRIIGKEDIPKTLKKNHKVY